MKYLKNRTKNPQGESCDGQTLPTLRYDTFLTSYSQHLAQHLMWSYSYMFVQSISV